jgi:maltooligosyltrehalose trehalohydrolase
MASPERPKQHGARLNGTGVDYRVWSPAAEMATVQVKREGRAGHDSLTLNRAPGGWFEANDPEGQAGDLYFFRLDGTRDVPDVASRYQPEGVRGLSQVMPTGAYAWHDHAWRRPQDLILYELHVGTFTEEGTFLAIIERLEHLRRLGVTAIELMPVAAFPGARNWGYDVVLPFAPADAYGTPDDLRRLVEAAHEQGLAVLLDVVYNHVCGEPNWLEATSEHYFHDVAGNDWGRCLNLDGEHSGPVRQYFLENIIYWMEEFHCDGFRLDAVHALRDSSPVHLLQEIAREVHARGGIVIAEDNSNDARMMRPVEQGGMGMDAAWADDFHHVVKMSLRREAVAHFKSYQGTTQELAETIEHGWLFRGQEFPYWQKPRGTECRDRAPAQFVYCISNHDQSGNRPLGERPHQLTGMAGYRAATMLLLLCPYTPMLFMGQEWAASTPFVFFTNHTGDFGACTSEGRLREFKNFGAAWPEAMLEAMPDPERLGSFMQSKLHWPEIGQPAHGTTLAFYQACLHLRRADPVLQLRGRDHWRVWAEGELLCLHYQAAEGQARLLVVHLQAGPVQTGWPASVTGENWTVLLGSEDRRFGGGGRRGYNTATRALDMEGPEALLFGTT